MKDKPFEIDFLAGLPKPIQPAQAKEKKKIQTPAWAKKKKAEAEKAGENHPAAGRRNLALAQDEVEEKALMPARTQALEGEVLEPIAYHDGSAQAAAAEYPEEVREAVLGLIIDKGQGIMQVCRETGIGRETIRTWLLAHKQERDIQAEASDIRQAAMLEGVSDEILGSFNKTKLDQATVRDLGIAYGILRDKLKDIRGPRSGSGNLHLRAVFRGEGAIEVHTGES